MKSIYVGNLNFQTTREALESLFGQYGEVHSAKIITDRETGKSRGFGFVEMDTEQADTAVRELEGQEFEGRTLKVNEARPKKPRQAW
jgi:RNA recognition motif-containing protein